MGPSGHGNGDGHGHGAAAGNERWELAEEGAGYEDGDEEDANCHREENLVVRGFFGPGVDLSHFASPRGR